MASQAALAVNLPDEQVRQRPVVQVGEELLDDGVAAVLLLGLGEFVGAVGEDGVVAPGGEQLALPGAAFALSRDPASPVFRAE